uniref:Protein kinase, AMP-activated, beta 1 non-catalytic subunit, a n=1 Tax=Hippocampus comes TaxID=109280 RepID=A0A3Q3DYM5_HIPCM
MGNTSSERAAMGHGDKAQRRDSRGTKDGERPKILMDSPEDADIFHSEDLKVEFLAWRQDLDVEDKDPTLDRPTVFRWKGDGKEVYLSGSFNNWANKIPLIRSQNTFVTIVELPEGEHQYKFYVILNKDTGISCDPALLPEPNHVMLNHLYALSIKDGVMVLSATHRYKKKYVTTLLYKPI